MRDSGRPDEPGHSPAACDAGQLGRIIDLVCATGYRFITPTPASHAIVNARPQNRRAHTLADAFGWSRPFAESLVPAELFGLLRSQGLLDRDGVLWRSRVRLSTLGQSLFMHSAFPTEAKDAVFFGPDTYKFCDAITACLSRLSRPVRRAADLCAGAGPGGLTIARFAPGADVLMLDINPVALRYATANAAAARSPHAVARHSDLLDAVDGDFDLIVAHPPYLIDRTHRAYRHGGGHLGADVSHAIVDASLGRLARGGKLLLFTGIAMMNNADPFLAAISPRLNDAGLRWSYREIDPDVFGEELAHGSYQNADRIALVVLEADRPMSSACA